MREGPDVRTDREWNAGRDLLLEFLDLVIELQPLILCGAVLRGEVLE
jgi:hypothetical protein